MPELFAILIKINIALVLFCLGYYLVLRKLTFYTLNRVYLVTAIIFSSAYPFVDLSALAQQHHEIVAPVQNVVIVWQAPVENLVKQAAYWNWLEVLFWAGAAFFTLRLLMQLISLYKIYRRSTAREINGQTVRVVSGDISPFSFWRSIYINPDSLSQADLHNILEHEQIHVNEWHTLDVLLTEISVIFYWFNPGIWMMKKAVRENIEFITDRKILQKGMDSKAYQYSLLNITFNQPAPAITSNFNFSTLKKRIMMMNAERSSNLNLTRYAFLMPVVVICLFVFSLSKTETVQASPAFKAVTAALEDIKTLAFEADTTPVKKTAKNAIQPEKNNVSGVMQNAASATDLIKKIETAGVTVQGYNGNDSIIIVLDGKAISKSDMHNLNPNTIKSVDVIKGSSSISGYLKNMPEVSSKIGNGNKPSGIIFISTHGDSDPNGWANIISKSSINEVNVVGYGIKDKEMRQSANLGSVSSQIRIRGAAGPNDPLILVDGKEESSIQGIDASTIESVTVLKDASATAAYNYSEKAKNGVIVVTTKNNIGVKTPKPNEVVVVGYGIMSKTTRQADTAASLSSQLRVRGGSENEPLILVDGKELTLRLDTIDPNIIESVSVLKDASATAAYSNNIKAKNGVIIITTKQK